jgi:hypothetical protein
VRSRSPGVVISGPAERSARLPCFVLGARRAILPAFGRLTGLALVEPAADETLVAIAGSEALRAAPSRRSRGRSLAASSPRKRGPRLQRMRPCRPRQSGDPASLRATPTPLDPCFRRGDSRCRPAKAGPSVFTRGHANATGPLLPQGRQPMSSPRKRAPSVFTRGHANATGPPASAGWTADVVPRKRGPSVFPRGHADAAGPRPPRADRRRFRPFVGAVLKPSRTRGRNGG